MRVHEIFRSIQGEGFHTGVPMTFIRLLGCNQNPRCYFCDTPQDSGDFIEVVPPMPEEYSKVKYLTITEVVSKVMDDWVCVTGGEPTIYPDLGLLCEALVNEGHYVALETNGTNPIPLGFHWVCVSPKSVWPSEEVFEWADEIKLLAGSGFYDARLKVRDYAADWIKEDKVVSVQPVWDDNYEQNLKDAIKIAQFYGVRLSIQLHKYIEVR